MHALKLIFSRLSICIFVIAVLVAAIIFLCYYIHSLLPAAVAIALAYALSLAAAIVLLLSKSPSNFKCGWLVVIIILPAAGAVLYFINFLSAVERCGNAPQYPQARCIGYEYFKDGGEYLNRLCALISNAKHRIYLEYYIISKGHIWGAIEKELEKALARGVEIKIIYDGLGSALRAPKKDLKKLKKAGAQIKVFNKLLPLPTSRLNFRDHRKIGLIDDAVFLGGVNIADEYANLTAPHGYWKDGGALFFGEIAQVYAGIYMMQWMRECPVPPPETGAEDCALAFTPIADEPECRGSVYEDALASLIYSAQERVDVFTPYLCMGDKLFDALTYAAGRGVCVRIIIPHIPDKKLTYAITRTYCNRLLEYGVQIYTYTPGFMHFKGVVCDDRALLGSYNFDYRSMRLNYECGVLGGDRLADDLERDFEECVAVSAPYRAGKPGPLKKLAGGLITLFAPLV